MEIARIVRRTMDTVMDDGITEKDTFMAASLAVTGEMEDFRR